MDLTIYTPLIGLTTGPSTADRALAWGGVVLFLLVAAVHFWIGWRQLRGDRRRWTVAPPVPLQISERNTWPFMVIAFGAFWLMVAAATVFEALGSEEVRQFIWSWPAFVPLGFVVLSFVYWPLALAPAWYRRWASQPDPRQTSPWPLEEAAEFLAAAPAEGPARGRLVADISASGQDPDRAWALTGAEGPTPATSFQRSVQTARDEEERLRAAGIDPKDTFASAAFLKKERQKRRQARREGRSD